MSKKIIPYGRQHIDDTDIEAVVQALQSDFLTQGPKIAEFEQAFAEYVQCKYAVAVANGTAALHLGALALGLKEGQRVLTTPITFAASANCIEYCGADAHFIDIDEQGYLIDLDLVEKELREAEKGTFTGIIPVDFAGNPVQLERLRKLADQYGLWIMEDACHAPGAYFKDDSGREQRSGNGAFADLSVFSFHPVKHIACGEGGMITTNDKVLYEKLITLRTHGITRNADLYENSVELANGASGFEDYPNWYMEMQHLGYNYRLTDIQAALGCTQLQKADAGIERRTDIAQKYANAFDGKDFLKGQSGVVEGHAYHLYVIEVERRRELYDYLREHGIFAQIHYIPAHLMPYYQKKGWKSGDFPKAEKYYQHCISLPMYPGLSDEEQQYVIERILTFYHG
ncbi:MAG: UDP-4-amino-4,6-dideoxy-N-acetyl-beta-L-altrosamine transaminase [Bacteroidetes bacterium]|nr:MAG: UDP-4-amino-4,6-dideoxy-N-acetyl-beta-L-altrosamine transaminase [Bacteroidota bacterium]